MDRRRTAAAVPFGSRREDVFSPARRTSAPNSPPAFYISSESESRNRATSHTTSPKHVSHNVIDDLFCVLPSESQAHSTSLPVENSANSSHPHVPATHEFDDFLAVQSPFDGARPDDLNVRRGSSEALRSVRTEPELFRGAEYEHPAAGEAEESAISGSAMVRNSHIASSPFTETVPAFDTLLTPTPFYHQHHHRALSTCGDERLPSILWASSSERTWSPAAASDYTGSASLADGFGGAARARTVSERASSARTSRRTSPRIQEQQRTKVTEEDPTSTSTASHKGRTTRRRTRRQNSVDVQHAAPAASPMTSHHTTPLVGHPVSMSQERNSTADSDSSKYRYPASPTKRPRRLVSSYLHVEQPKRSQPSPFEQITQPTLASLNLDTIDLNSFGVLGSSSTPAGGGAPHTVMSPGQMPGLETERYFGGSHHHAHHHHSHNIHSSDGTDVGRMNTPVFVDRLIVDPLFPTADKTHRVDDTRFVDAEFLIAQVQPTDFDLFNMASCLNIDIPDSRTARSSDAASHQELSYLNLVTQLDPARPPPDSTRQQNLRGGDGISSAAAAAARARHHYEVKEGAPTFEATKESHLSQQQASIRSSRSPRSRVSFTLNESRSAEAQPSAHSTASASGAISEHADAAAAEESEVAGAHKVVFRTASYSGADDSQFDEELVVPSPADFVETATIQRCSVAAPCVQSEADDAIQQTPSDFLSQSAHLPRQRRSAASASESSSAGFSLLTAPSLPNVAFDCGSATTLPPPRSTVLAVANQFDEFVSSQSRATASSVAAAEVTSAAANTFDAFQSDLRQTESRPPFFRTSSVERSIHANALPEISATQANDTFLERYRSHEPGRGVSAFQTVPRKAASEFVGSPPPPSAQRWTPLRRAWSPPPTIGYGNSFEPRRAPHFLATAVNGTTAAASASGTARADARAGGSFSQRSNPSIPSASRSNLTEVFLAAARSPRTPPSFQHSTRSRTEVFSQSSSQQFEPVNSNQFAPPPSEPQYDPPSSNNIEASAHTQALAAQLEAAGQSHTQQHLLSSNVARSTCATNCTQTDSSDSTAPVGSSEGNVMQTIAQLCDIISSLQKAQSSGAGSTSSSRVSTSTQVVHAATQTSTEAKCQTERLVCEQCGHCQELNSRPQHLSRAQPPFYADSEQLIIPEERPHDDVDLSNFNLTPSRTHLLENRKRSFSGDCGTPKHARIQQLPTVRTNFVPRPVSRPASHMPNSLRSSVPAALGSPSLPQSSDAGAFILGPLLPGGGLAAARSMVSRTPVRSRTHHEALRSNALAAAPRVAQNLQLQLATVPRNLPLLNSSNAHMSSVTTDHLRLSRDLRPSSGAGTRLPQWRPAHVASSVCTDSLPSACVTSATTASGSDITFVFDSNASKRLTATGACVRPRPSDATSYLAFPAAAPCAESADLPPENPLLRHSDSEGFRFERDGITACSALSLVPVTRTSASSADLTNADSSLPVTTRGAAADEGGALSVSPSPPSLIVRERASQSQPLAHLSLPPQQQFVLLNGQFHALAATATPSRSHTVASLTGSVSSTAVPVPPSLAAAAPQQRRRRVEQRNSIIVVAATPPPTNRRRRSTALSNLFWDSQARPLPGRPRRNTRRRHAERKPQNVKFS